MDWVILLNLVPFFFTVVVGLLIYWVDGLEKKIVVGIVAILLSAVYMTTLPSAQPKRSFQRNLDIPLEQSTAPIQDRLRSPEKSDEQRRDEQYQRYSDGLPWSVE